MTEDSNVDSNVFDDVEGQSKPRGKRSNARTRDSGERRRRRGALNERDILRVDGLDPAYVGHWFTEDKVYRKQKEDWDLVTWSEIEGIGDARAMSAPSPDERVTIRNRDGTILVLMKKRKEWDSDDYKQKQSQITEVERSMRRSYGKQIQDDGFYGDISITSKDRP